jgi:hypothetical protein
VDGERYNLNRNDEPRRDLIERGTSFPDSPDSVAEMLKNRAGYLREYEKKHGK